MHDSMLYIITEYAYPPPRPAAAAARRIHARALPHQTDRRVASPVRAQRQRRHVPAAEAAPAEAPEHAGGHGLGVLHPAVPGHPVPAPKQHSAPVRIDAPTAPRHASTLSGACLCCTPSDLKSANVFLSSKNCIKIGDLGVAKLLAATRSVPPPPLATRVAGRRGSLRFTAAPRRAMAKTQIGTPYYVSPELWKNRPYNAKSDIWATGCLL